MKNRIENLGLNYKKEIIILIFIPFSFILFALASYILLKNNLLSLFFLISSLSYIVYFFFKLNSLEAKQKRKKINDFINYFSYFKIYLNNGETVYSSLTKTIEFSNDNLRENIETLINDINNDKSIKPFISFAKNFPGSIIEQIMISIFEMIDNGNNINYISQFNKIFEDFKIRNKKIEEEKRFNKFDSLLNSSLIGSGIIMIILVFGIVNLVGEII